MLWKLFVADLKMLARNRQSLFWAFMFPIMFTFIFGFFFGKNTTAASIDLVNNSKTEIGLNLAKAFKDSGSFKVNEVDNDSQIRDRIKKSMTTAGVLIPENFGIPSANTQENVLIIYDPGNSQSNQAIFGFVQTYLTQVNFQIQKVNPIFGIQEEKINNRSLTYFDFVLAGILGLALMNASIIGIGVNMAKYREDKILKRITTTPLKSWQFITAEILSRLILNALQVIIILAIGKLFFDAHIYGNIFIIFAVAMVGAVLFQLLGFIIAVFSKTTDAAQGMAQAIAIPMMFLSGVFFPIDSLPKWLYSIVQFLPLAPLLRIIRGVMLDAASPFDNMRNVYIVIAWIVVAALFSSWRFRLSDE
jgi:ABC-2 type transport system permease protein